MTATWGGTGTGTFTVWNTSSTTSTAASININPSYWVDDSTTVYTVPEQIVKDLLPGRSYDLPDGAKLTIDQYGNYRINDRKARVRYRANNNRAFNPFLNASDLLEAFIRTMGVFALRQGEVLQVPIGVFINWLILKAAEQDEEHAHYRCGWCGRFVKQGLLFCDRQHLQRRMAMIPKIVGA